MDAIGNIISYVWDFAGRGDFIGLYALALGVICLSFGLRTALRAEGYDFGLKGGFVTNDQAIRVGQIWLLLALLLLVSGWVALLAA